MIAIGSIYYLQDRGFFHVRFGGRAICRNPWIVEAFPGGTFAAARGNRETGHWEDVIISGRSDTAVVRSLRDGHRCSVAVRILELHDDHGLTMQATTYPCLPDLSLYKRRGCREHNPSRGPGLAFARQGVANLIRGKSGVRLATLPWPPLAARWAKRAT